MLETKGEHLAGGGTEDVGDAAYKERVFDALQGAFNDWGQMQVREGPMKGTFRLVFDGRFEELPLADPPP